MHTREEHVNNLAIDNIVAFKSEGNMFSGKVLSIGESEVTIQTLNNSIFYVEKYDIVWVKTGSYWPTGIYNALKYAKKASKRTEHNP